MLYVKLQVYKLPNRIPTECQGLMVSSPTSYFEDQGSNLIPNILKFLRVFLGHSRQILK